MEMWLLHVDLSAYLVDLSIVFWLCSEETAQSARRKHLFVLCHQFAANSTHPRANINRIAGVRPVRKICGCPMPDTADSSQLQQTHQDTVEPCSQDGDASGKKYLRGVKEKKKKKEWEAAEEMFCGTSVSVHCGPWKAPHHSSWMFPEGLLPMEKQSKCVRGKEKQRETVMCWL